MLFAALDGSEVIHPSHVFAALEVVRYSHDSARYIWGERTGNKDADRILNALRTEGEKVRSELFLLFSGNIKAERLQAALDLLLEHGYAQREERAPKEGGHKPVEVENWHPSTRGVFAGRFRQVSGAPEGLPSATRCLRPHLCTTSARSHKRRHPRPDKLPAIPLPATDQGGQGARWFWQPLPFDESPHD